MRTSDALLAACLVAVMLTWQMPRGVTAGRFQVSRGGDSRMAPDEEFERYAVRVNRATEKSFGGVSRRDRFARGRIMQQIVCGTGQTTCGTVCVNTTSSPTNCGTCGTVCQLGYLCCSGRCVSGSSKWDCGECGNFCESGCQLGVCGYGS